MTRRAPGVRHRPLARALVGFLLVVALGALPASAQVAPPTLAPNDPGYRAYPGSLGQVQAPEAWAAVKCTVTVAYIDSGVSPDADLRAVGGDGAADDNGHGTAVASVGSGLLDNGFGVAGICGNGNVLSRKVMNAAGRYEGPALATAIRAAVDEGAKVVNLSLWWDTSTRLYPPVGDAIRYAYNRGVVVVVIAGNGTNDDSRGTTDPGANLLASESPEAIRVGGVDADNQIDAASNRGSWVDITAPYDTMALNLDGSFSMHLGTSFAAPAVSGAVALLLSYNPRLTPDQVKADLVAGCTHVPGLDVGNNCLLNVYGALLAAGYTPPSLPLTVKVSGKGYVTVSDGNTAIKCFSTCRFAKTVGTDFDLRAHALPGWRFKGWQGSCRNWGNSSDCSLELATPATATAVFAKVKKKSRKPAAKKK